MTSRKASAERQQKYLRAVESEPVPYTRLPYMAKRRVESLRRWRILRFLKLFRSMMRNERVSGLSIGAKFVALILATLLTAIALVLANAAVLFKKDNLNNIYSSSDALTAAKAGEVRAWLDGVVKKGAAVGRVLNERSPANAALTDAALKAFEDDELIAAHVFDRIGPVASSKYVPKATWFNSALGKRIELTPEVFERFRAKLGVRFDRVQVGGFEAQSETLPSGELALVLTVPLFDRPAGIHDKVLSLAVLPTRLQAAFGDTAPYQTALLDRVGQVIAHSRKELATAHESLAQVPIVKRMIESRIDREFQEFRMGDIDYLGAYARVGVGGLAVVSQVERAIAFESGEVLVRRSVLIAAIVFSASFIVAYLFAQSLVAPIRKLRRAAERISKGDFKVRVHVSSRDEMLTLAQSFNAMGTEIARKLDNLSRINEASKTISSTHEEPALIGFALETLVALLGCGRATGWLWKGQHRAHSASRHWFEPDPSLEESERLSRLEKPELVSLKIPGSALGVVCLAVPIRTKSKTAGLVLLAEPSGGRSFTDEDLFTAGTLLTSVGITVENIELIRQTADKARMEKELETAKLVQDTMFPPTEIDSGHVRTRSYYTPAGECGGDWWTLLELPGDRVFLAVADATGHGVPAALVTATAKAACSVIHGIAQANPDFATSPGLVLNFLNKAVYESTLGQVMMTFFAAVIDKKTGEMTYASASHDPIYWYKTPEGADPASPGSKANIDVLLPEPGPRLGQQEKAVYEQASSQLSPGDLLVLYTDGLTEGKNGAHEEWGDRKFMRSILKRVHHSPEAVRDTVLEDFRIHIEKEPLHDDVTLVVLKYGA